MTENRLYELRTIGRRYILSHLFNALEGADELTNTLEDDEKRYLKEYIYELVDGFEWEIENMIE